MKKMFLSFIKKSQHGGMLVELMMTIALATILIPFIFRYQQNVVYRARNIAVAKQMEVVQSVLERYIVENKTELMKPLGKKITRIKISDLLDYGLPDYIAENYKNDYQLRILKSADKNNKSTLQGIVILNDSTISPLRTHEIVNMGGGKIGFVEGNNTYGGFGAFHASASDFGINDGNGIIGTTSVKRGNTDYLWRVPSDNKEDSMMLSMLNLDGHDIDNVKFFDADKAQFEEKLVANKLVAGTIAFANRTTLNSVFSSENILVNGTMTADARSLNISDVLTLSDSGKFSSFFTNDLYTNNLTLSGFSVSSTSGKSAVLKIIGDMDMIMGRINASYVSVGYTGSVTPRLYITDKIQDAKDSSYYWDIKNSKARFSDVIFPELSRMAINIVSMESKPGTQTTTIFSGIVANTNATVGDYLNAINEIQIKVREKYHLLNLE
ncbi:MAG: hypothetical protein IKZ49_03800 [Alphaproteobacteria bacterium]|nr:hypothetical protein [Alphaproteobacteria bacterium]